jgi:hypothetical protein
MPYNGKKKPKLWHISARFKNKKVRPIYHFPKNTMLIECLTQLRFHTQTPISIRVNAKDKLYNILL